MDALNSHSKQRKSKSPKRNKKKARPQNDLNISVVAVKELALSPKKDMMDESASEGAAMSCYLYTKKGKLEAYRL